MIVVTGANGPFGSQVVEHLLARIPAAELAVSVRDPAAASRWAEAGVSVRHGDFDHPATLPTAFAGAGVVLINGTNYGTTADQRTRQLTAALNAAAGTHVVITTWPDAARYPLPYPKIEHLVPDDGTVLRLNYGLAASIARDVIWARKSDVLRAPAGAARLAPADTSDLAEATAAVLTSTGHAGKSYDLTSPDALTWADLATLAGPGVEYVPVTDAEFHAICAQKGFPAPLIDDLIAYYAAIRSGWSNTPASDLEALLGRPPTPALQAVANAVYAWSWG